MRATKITGNRTTNGNILALLAICAGNLPVSGEFHAQRPVTRGFDVFFVTVMKLNKNPWFSREMYVDFNSMVHFGMFIYHHFISEYV